MTGETTNEISNEKWTDITVKEIRWLSRKNRKIKDNLEKVELALLQSSMVLDKIEQTGYCMELARKFEKMRKNIQLAQDAISDLWIFA